MYWYYIPIIKQRVKRDIETCSKIRSVIRIRCLGDIHLAFPVAAAFPFELL
jgi:hypothetical protein